MSVCVCSLFSECWSVVCLLSSLSVCLLSQLSVCLSVCQCVSCTLCRYLNWRQCSEFWSRQELTPNYLSIQQSFYLSFSYISIYLFTCLSIHLPNYIYYFLYNTYEYMYIYFCMFLSIICLSIYLSLLYDRGMR